MILLTISFLAFSHDTKTRIHVTKIIKTCVHRSKLRQFCCPERQFWAKNDH